MALCDVRHLLLLSLENKSEDAPFRHAKLEASFKYHDSIFCLRAGAQAGCPLCGLVWQGCNSSPHQIDESAGLKLTDAQLTERWPGEIFLGTSSWRDGDHPSVIVTSKHSGPQEKNQLTAPRGSTRCELDVFAKSGHVPQDRPDLIALLSREIFEDSSSQPCLAVGKKWLETCLRDHSQCTAAQPNQYALPTRVIDVGSISRNPSLFVSQGVIGSWTALSYCWGGASDFTLTKGSFGDLSKGCPLSSFPNTLRDAILITRALGVRYLWIDALCIIQDSKDDWSVEAPKMGDIYRNALVTIAAAVSRSVTGGILGPRKRHRACEISWKVPGPDQTEQESLNDWAQINVKLPEQPVHISLHRTMWEGASCQAISEWARRGGTMQEEFLASRILAYTSLDVTWSFVSARLWEAEPKRAGTIVSPDFKRVKSHQRDLLLQNFPKLRPKMPLTRDATEDEKWADINENEERDKYVRSFWYGIVSQYTMRRLSYEEDRLPAIGALGRFFQVQLEDTYCAGLWRKDLVKGLLWHGTVMTDRVVLEYIGPSWSWVCVELDMARWKLEEGHAYKELAVINDVSLQYDAPNDPFGRLNGGTLTLSAPYSYLTAITEPKGHRVNASLTKFEHFICQFLNISDKSEFLHKHIPCPNQYFAALQMVTGIDSGTKEPFLEFLLLESVGEYVSVRLEPHHENLFRRIGRISLRTTQTPDPKARQNYWSTGPIGIVENAAWWEVSKQIWPSRKFTII